MTYPRLNLPSWAINNSILDAIEEHTLDVIANMDTPDEVQQETNESILHSIETMRAYINGTDGTTFTLT